MAWDIGADETIYSPGQPVLYAALDAYLFDGTGTNYTRTAALDARIIGSGAGGGPWDIGADELTGTDTCRAYLDARIVDLTNSQTVTASADSALAPQTPSGLHVTAAGVDWVSLAWTDNSGGNAQHRVYYRKISQGTFTDYALLMEGDTTDTVYFLAPDTVYVFAVAAVSLDGVEGPAITVTYPSVPGGTITAGVRAVFVEERTLTTSCSAFIAYGSTGPAPPALRTVTGRHV